MTTLLEEPSLRIPTTAPPARARTPAAASRARRHAYWLAAGFPLSFLVPFLLADVAGLQRDLFYGLYAAAVAAFVLGWARDTGVGRAALTHNWRWGLGLGVLAGAGLALVVFRTEDLDSASRRARARRPSALAGRRVRRDRRRPPLRVPDPRQSSASSRGLACGGAGVGRRWSGSRLSWRRSV